MPRGQLTLGQFGVKLATFTAELPKSMVHATGKAGLLVATSVRGTTRADSGGDMMLSGVGRTGAKVGARYDVKGQHNPVALVRATGPMQLLESDTSAHVILPRGVGRGHGRTKAGRRAAKQALYEALFASRYSGVKPLRTPYGPRYRVQHPGTRGKQTWSRGVEAVIGDVPKVYQRELRKHLQRFFG